MRPRTALLALAAGPASAAPITVTTLDDEVNADGDGALREAVEAAETDAAVEASGAVTVTLAACVLTSGDASSDGAAVSLGGTGGTLVVDRCIVSDNRVPNEGGAISANGAEQTLVLTRSTFTGNHAGTMGGALFIVGANTAVTVDASTFSGNSADGDGGAIRLWNGALTLTNSTLTGNTADADGDGDGGGIYANGSSFSVGNTLIAGNADASPPSGSTEPDVRNGFQFVSLGANLIGVNDGANTEFPAGLPNANGDWAGTAAVPLDARLGPLADNGGPTPTHLPAPASPAVDNGACAGATTDQRGEPRPSDVPGVPNANDGCDIGAVEVQATTTATEGTPGGAAYALGPVHPNPAAGHAAATLTVARTQRVEAVLYDLTGRRVAVVFRGTLAAGAPHTLALDGRGLPDGLYVLRVTGEAFAAARRVVLAR